MLKATVYLTGAGPGDCGLVTVRALELIRRADCIIYDYLVNPQLLAYAAKDCKIIYAGKKAGAHTLPQDKINQLLVKQARRHHTVVRLKGGDPFIFGRGAEEALYLKKKKVNFEIIPGVTSAIAAAAYAGIPLTERSRASTVGFITGHEDPLKAGSGIDWNALAKALGTMVFLMGVGNLGVIAKRLIACGKSKNTPVAVISWGTTVKQKTVTGNLGNIIRLAEENNIAPPAIIVVGEVVNLRKSLKWFETRPLFGKRIIVTRARHQASVFAERLIALGAEVIEIPVIKIVSLNPDAKLSEALLCNEYDWVFFTSQNGVSEFATFLNRAGKDSRILGRAKVCAIGPETARGLCGIGIKPDYIPPEFVAESIVRNFKRRSVKGRVALRALILRAKKARDVLPEGLKKAGFKIKIIGLYDTVLAKEHGAKLRQALACGADFVTFTSSSCVTNFIKLLGRGYRHKLSGVKLASIGPITSKALKGFGLKPDAEAKVYTIEGLIRSMVKKND